MTIDERIERLTEKHEALAQSVELIAALTQENSASIQKLVEATNNLVKLTDRDAEHIRALPRIPEAHEHRITGLEDRG